MKLCKICGTSYNVEKHHIMFRSEVKALEHCELNLVYLCSEHHKGTHGPHGSKGSSLNRKLKLGFQNKLEMFWYKPYLNKEDIQEVLGISENALNKLLKTLRAVNQEYVREDVIRACMGGKLILEKSYGL